MGVWTTRAIPALWNGVPVRVMDHEKAIEYHVVETGAINRLGGAHTPQGGGSEQFTHTFVFAGAEFQAYKVFEALLDIAAQSPIPAVFINPIEGPKTVWPKSRQTKIVAKDGPVALVSVRLVEHVVGVKPPPAAAPFVWQVFAPGTITVNLAGYLARLAFMEAWNAAALAAFVATSAAALILDLPTLFGDSMEQWANTFERICVNFLVEPFQKDKSLADEARRASESTRARVLSYLESNGLPTNVYDRILAGGAYSAGPLGGGWSPTPAEVPMRAHAAVVFGAMWECYAVGSAYNDLLDAMRDQNWARAMDAREADAAAVTMRRWFQRANRLATAAMPYDAAPITTQNARLAASLVRAVEQFRFARPPAREVTLPSDNRPLSRIAIEYLGDAERAQEILDLNPDVIADFNRLPAGTTIRVPAA